MMSLRVNLILVHVKPFEMKLELENLIFNTFGVNLMSSHFV